MGPSGSAGSTGPVGPTGPAGASAVSTVQSTTANYTILNADSSKLFLCSGGAFSLTFPSAVTVGNGWNISVRNVYANSTAQGTVSLASVSGQTFNGLASPFPILPGQECWIISDGTNWQITHLNHEVLLVSDDVVAAVASKAYALPVGFRRFRLSFHGVLLSAEAKLGMQFSMNNGVSYHVANYVRAQLYDSGTAAVGYFNAANETLCTISPALQVANTSEGGSTQMELYPGSSTKFASWQALSGGIGATSGWWHAYLLTGHCLDAVGPVNFINVLPNAAVNINEMHVTITGTA